MCCICFSIMHLIKGTICYQCCIRLFPPGMKMMGLQGFVYWVSWISVHLINVVILAVIFTVVLPLVNVLPNVNFFLLWLLFFLFGISSLSFALLLSTFFNKAKVSTITRQSKYYN